MEVEYIDENTIRVRIGNEDLEARGYTFLDLLGNHEKVESFFYSILEEVDVDNQFQDSDAVTFQVMPRKNGLELYISKDENLKENFLNNKEKFERLQAEEIEEEAMSPFDNDISKEEDEDLTNEKDTNYKHFVVRFNIVLEMVKFAQMYHNTNVNTNLYSYNDQYYLEFFLEESDTAEITLEEEYALINEYSFDAKYTPEMIAEYGKLLYEENALEVIVENFEENK